MQKNKEMTLPNSMEVEYCCLSNAMASIDALNRIVDKLTETDFYYTENRIVFSVMKSLYKANKVVDVYTVSEELKNQKQYEQAGGMKQLGQIGTHSSIVSSTEEYINILLEKSKRRKIIQLSEILSQKAFDESNNILEIVDQTQKDLISTSSNFNFSGFQQIADVKSSLGLNIIEDLEKRQEHFHKTGEQLKPPGVSSGFYDLDDAINGGFQNGHLIILAARPAMGKTALAINFADHACLKENKTVGMFSLEMNAYELCIRRISSYSAVPMQNIITNRLEDGDFPAIHNAHSVLEKHPFYIDDQKGLSISELRSRARRMKSVHGIDLLVIDYLQYIKGSKESKSQSRQIEIAEVSRELKVLAGELDIPIICLAQVNRESESGTVVKAPSMSNIRESGAIEQDADLVIILHRPDYYDIHDKPNLAEIIIEKNRHGPCKSITARFEKSVVQFVNYSWEKKDD